MTECQRLPAFHTFHPFRSQLMFLTLTSLRQNIGCGCCFVSNYCYQLKLTLVCMKWLRDDATCLLTRREVLTRLSFDVAGGCHKRLVIQFLAYPFVLGQLRLQWKRGFSKFEKKKYQGDANETKLTERRTEVKSFPRFMRTRTLCTKKQLWATWEHVEKLPDF